MGAQCIVNGSVYAVVRRNPNCRSWIEDGLSGQGPVGPEMNT